MKIDRIERSCAGCHGDFFETSFGRSYDRTFVLVRVEGTALGVKQEGWGESVAEANPYYSSETTETVWHITEGFIAPLLLGQSFDHPREVYPALRRIRGHNMAKAGVEMAIWDLYARLQGQPLSKILGGTRERIASGVSIGIQDSLDQLMEKIEKELAAGYQRIKIKIKPGWDIEAVERVRARFGDIPLQVDANAAYSPGRLRAARAARSIQTLLSSSRSLRRCDGPSVLQASHHDSGVLDESIHTVRIARDAIDAKAANHQHQARTRRRPPGLDRAYTICARRTTFRCGTAACSRAALAGPTTSTSPACRISACPATSRRASATTSPTLSIRPLISRQMEQ